MTWSISAISGITPSAHTPVPNSHISKFGILESPTSGTSDVVWPTMSSDR